MGNVVRVIAAVGGVGLTVISPNWLISFLSERPVADVIRRFIIEMIAFLCIGRLLNIMHCHATTRVRVASFERRMAPKGEGYHVVVEQMRG